MDAKVNYNFPVDPDAYLKTYLDPEFTRAMYLEGLDFEAAEILEQDENGGNVTRRMRIRPKMNAPKVVQKVLGASQEYVEDGELDAGNNVWHYTVIPNSMANKMTIRGELRVTEASGGCNAEFTSSFDVRIFGVGGAVEKFMAGQFKDNIAKQAEFTKKWLAARA